MRKFKDIILKLRDEKGMTQAKLATELKISKSTIAMWETGKRFPSKELYEQIADLFNVDIDYLYGRTDVRQKVHFDNDGTPYTAVNTMAAHFEGEDYTENEIEEIVRYAKYLKAQRDSNK